MPFETFKQAPRRIAVIGGGISGMGAAHLLAAEHNVVLFEDEPRFGGHARTVLAGKTGDQPVDTGFIVFNNVNYPHLLDLFTKLDVPIAKSDMSFAASINGGAFEYGLHSLNALFAQPKHMLSPKFMGMCRDVLRFNKNALALADDPDMTIGQLLDRLGTGEYFRDYYILPLSGAIWSTPSTEIMDFPAQTLVQFFKNHALMGITGQHQWYTVRGGSVEYVSRLIADLGRQGVELRDNTPVQAVKRVPCGVLVKARGGEYEPFDEVIFATHSDITMSLLADATPDEQAALGAIKYQPNQAVLHADTRLMPKRRKVWASWNYCEQPGARGDKIDLTYWMNKLQPIPADDPMFVTLNSNQQIRDELIYDSVSFSHPVYDLAAQTGRAQIRDMQGRAHTWFCGAWMKNGFHEDGLASAVDVVQGLANRTLTEGIAAQ